MTRELILENCIRISQFFKNKYTVDELKSEISIVEESIIGLLKIYGRILDFNGAPARDLSTLYLTDDAYDKMDNKLIEMGIKVDYKYLNHSCWFQYDGYHWVVINEDAIRKSNEEFRKQAYGINNKTE
jgi:hypothetical protein